MENAGGSEIPKQGIGNSKYFSTSGQWAVPVNSAPTGFPVHPALLVWGGKWCPQESMSSVLRLTRLGDTRFKGNFKIVP